MKKNFLIKLIAIVLIFSLTSCGGDKECTHEWADATCKTPKTCVKWNATEGGIGDHVYTDATCENAQECKYCGVWYGLSLGHKYDPATCYKPKTCQRCGKQVGEVSHTYCDATCTSPLTCSGCGATSGASLGHTFITTVIEPTCTADGSEIISCSVCTDVISTTVLPRFDHSSLEFVYNNDLTATHDGTATASCPTCNYSETRTITGSASLLAQAFSGKTVSILGDSISTYTNVSSGSAADTTNSTIRNNIVWYGYSPSQPTFGGTSVDSTWWQRTVNALGIRRLVNNSNAGESVYDAVVSRCTQLHDDTGSNAGEKPDIIIVYLGTNDNNRNKVDASSLTMSEIKRKGDDLSYTPSNLAEAYAVMLYRIQKNYPDAEIYCLTNIERSDMSVSLTHETSQVIRDVVGLFDGVYLADIGLEAGIEYGADDYYTYMPLDQGGKAIHPGVEGMRAISNVVIKAIIQNSRYVSDELKEMLAEYYG